MTSITPTSLQSISAPNRTRREEPAEPLQVMAPAAARKAVTAAEDAGSSVATDKLLSHVIDILHKMQRGSDEPVVDSGEADDLFATLDSAAAASPAGVAPVPGERVSAPDDHVNEILRLLGGRSDGDQS